MFVLGVIVGAIIICVIGVFVIAWVSKEAYMLGRKEAFIRRCVDCGKVLTPEEILSNQCKDCWGEPK